MRTDTAPAFVLKDYRPYPFAIDRVRLRFVLDDDQTRVDTVMTIRRVADGPLVLDGEGMALKSIAIDGRDLAPADYATDEASLTLHAVPDTFELQTSVEISPKQNSALSGLYVSGGRLCTQCEAHGFRRITYWPDRPDVMSRFHVRLEADPSRYPILLSNGSPGAAGRLDDGRHFAEWDDPHPKPSYLFALCAGDYDVYRDTFTTRSGAEVGLAIHVDKGDAERAAYAMDALKRSMRWDEAVFGREYDLGVFNIVAVRDFNFGAMENKGLNIFNSAYVLADEATATDMDFEAIESIVAHEYFHNWTGNRITCRDWFQLCLKEGLTVFRDQEFSADMRSRAVQRVKDVIRLRARQFAEDAGPLAHPVRPDQYGSVDNLYTATVYEKGAELIRMLKALIGEEAFSKGMTLYFDRHDGEAVTIEDFYACFEVASGRDLADFRLWYAQAGTPRVHARSSWDEGQGALLVTLKQTTPPTPGQPTKQAVPIPLRSALLAADGETLEERLIVLSDTETTVTFKGVPKGARLSLNRGFSAPVIVEWDNPEQTGLAMAAIETDPFNRWDLLQSQTTETILALAAAPETGGNDALVDAVVAAVSAAVEEDPAYAALLMRTPSVGELLQQRTPADPVALDAGRNRWRASLMAHPEMAAMADAVLGAPSPAPFAPTADQAGIRALRTAVISGLASLGPRSGPRLSALYESAGNMTEQLACLRSLIEAVGPDHACVEQFRKQWRHNPLIMDKWFGALALLAGNAAQVESLVDHDDFDMGNPNRIRAVVGTFAMQNLAAFHTPDGAGHAFLARFAKAADARNPALSARLLTAFEQWRTLEPEARESARRTLTDLSTSDLSPNSADIVSRCLG